MKNTIKWDRPCYKCRSHFCDLSCKEALAQPEQEPEGNPYDDQRRSMEQAFKEPEQEPVVVDRRLAIRTWAFLAQDCTPCAHEECQIDGKNIGVDTLCDAWNKTMDGTPTPPQRKPLTDEQAAYILAQLPIPPSGGAELHDWAMQAVKELAAHSIKENT